MGGSKAVAQDRQGARREPYHPIDADRVRYGTSEERKHILGEVLLWGWSGLVVIGVAFGIHELLSDGGLSLTYLAVGLIAAGLIGATEYHIVCNVLSLPNPPSRVLLYGTTAMCLGLLFVFNHVAVVSLLGTPRVEHDAWQRSVGTAKDTIISRLDGIELSLSQVIQSQLEPRAEEDAGTEPAADQKTVETANDLAAMLSRWSSAFSTLSTPLKQAAIAFEQGQDEAAGAERAAAIARALTTFNGKIGRETAIARLSAVLGDPTRAESEPTRRHLDTIARDLAVLGQLTVAAPARETSAGIGALSRLGRSLRALAGGAPANGKGLVSRDYIGMASSLLALLFVLLLQTNRRRFQFRPLPEPPDGLEAGPQTTTREP